MPDDMTARATKIVANALPGKTSHHAFTPDPLLLANPDMTMLRVTRPPPSLPLNVFGLKWGGWITEAATAAACPPDYVVAPLLASVSALIGNARWPAAPAWSEPPHLWFGVVGDSGGGKSPGADALMRDVLPEIERRMAASFPDELREWKVLAATHEAAIEQWKIDVKQAGKKNDPAPLPPTGEPPPEPQCPRLRQNDVTIERVATLLAAAAPKGLLVVRDELAGWFKGMNVYNESGRAFWIEAYGGRPYRVERQKHPQPIDIPRLAVAVTGGTQPDKLVEMMKEADDGLLARICWVWPERVPFRLGMSPPNTRWAIEALDCLRLLELSPPSTPDGSVSPVLVPLESPALADLEAFAQDMQERQEDAAGLMRSAYGKARGTALRLALVLEFLWWCGGGGRTQQPTHISHAAFKAAAHFIASYLMPMAERVYGDAAIAQPERNATTLARWIIKTQPREIHTRTLQRNTRLAGLRDKESIGAAVRALGEAGWLIAPEPTGERGRPAGVFTVNPRVYEVAP